MTNYRNVLLADALSTLDEDRVTQEQRDFDATYEAALLEDREMTAQAAKRIKMQKQSQFLTALATHFPININLVNEAEVVASVDGIGGKYRIALHQVLNFWDFPATVQVFKDSGRYQNYRPGKNGWNYAKIAEESYHRICQLVRWAARENTQRGNRGVAEQLREKLRLREYSSLVRPSMDTDKPVFVELQVTRAMTVEQAERVINLLKAEGLIADEFQK